MMNNPYTIMTSTQFGQTYLRFEAHIAKALKKLDIYDEDLLHDTYIALYQHSQHADIRNFANTFIAFYRARHKRRVEHEDHYECYDHTQLLNYDRPDESDLEYREKVGEIVDNLIDHYIANPLPGERNHERACQILLLYRDGFSHAEIAKRLNLDESTVKKYFKRTILKLKSHAQKAI